MFYPPSLARRGLTYSLPSAHLLPQGYAVPLSRAALPTYEGPDAIAPASPIAQVRIPQYEVFS